MCQIQLSAVMVSVTLLLQMMLDYFVSARCIFVLPYNADANDDLSKNCMKLHAIGVKILGKVRHEVQLCICIVRSIRN